LLTLNKLKNFGGHTSRDGIEGFWETITSNSLDTKSFLARYYAYLGKKNQALHWLRKSSEPTTPLLSSSSSA